MFKQVSRVLWRRWALLPLRLVIGYGFLAHGCAKLSRGPAGFGRLLEQIGAPLPELTAWASTLAEILGGLAILAGAFVAVASVPLIVMMLVALLSHVGTSGSSGEFGFASGVRADVITTMFNGTITLAIALFVVLVISLPGLFPGAVLPDHGELRDDLGNPASAVAVPRAQIGPWISRIPPRGRVLLREQCQNRL